MIVKDSFLSLVHIAGVSSMMLECGGLQFPGAPFAGWYQGTEVASRDFLDPQRYNLLNPIGDAMGLDKSSNTTLWKVRDHFIYSLLAFHDSYHLSLKG